MTEPYEAFFGQSPNTKDDVTIKETDKSIMKGWDEDWLRTIEFNQDGKELNNPYAQHPVVNRAVRTIAENIPQAKFVIHYVKDDKIVPQNHPISRLFRTPNEFMSRYEFWEAVSVYLNLRGEAFIYINQSIGGLLKTGAPPAELWVLNPRLVDHVIHDGRIKGWIYNKSMPIKTSEMIHFKLFNPNSFRGLSPLDPAKYELQADFAASKWNKIFFDNNATPSGIVELDKESRRTIEELTKVKRLWDERHAGVDNHGKVAFLLGGMTYKSMGISQREMDFINSRKLSRDSILSVFGVSPFVAGYYEGEVNRSTAFAAKRLFWTGTLKVQLTRIEEKFFTDFFSIYAPEFYGKFDYTGVEELQEDLTESLDRAKKAFDLGWSMNEINKAYHLGLPEKDFSGFRPMNFIKYDLDNKIDGTEFMLDEPEEVEISQENDKKSHKNTKIKSYSDNFLQLEGVMEKVLRSKLKKFFYNQRAEILKILNENKDFDPILATFLGKLGQIFDDSKQIIIEYVEPTYIESSVQAGELAYKYLGLEKEFIVNPRILNDRLNKIKRVNDTVYKNLKNDLATGISEGETIQELSKRVKGFYNELYNPKHQYLERIARTETSSLMNGTQFEIYKEEGVTQKQWIAEPDARDGHQIDGEVVPVNSLFSNGMLYPGDPSAGPEMVINCRCSISPYIE